MNVVAEKSSTGLDSNIAAALAYIPIVGLVFLVIEKGSRFVKFHSVQSLVFCAALFVAYIALMIFGFIVGMVPVLGWIVSFLLFFVWLALMIGSLVVWVIALIKAFQGEWYKLPYIGDIAERQSATL
jgi:uncharacterized membrane protein